MNIQQINIGQYPNDGSGDDLRTAFEKIVGNFSEIDLNVVLSAENIGNGAPIALVTPTNNALRFRTIISDNSNMSVSYDTDTITLSVSDLSLQDLTNVSSTSPNVNESLVWNGTVWAPNLLTFSLQDLTNVSNTSPNVNESLVWNGTAWAPAATVTKIIAGDNITISPTTGLGEVTIHASNNAPSDFNFGTLGNITSVFDLILQSTNVDFGTIYEQSSLMLDLGGIEGTLPPVPPTPTYSLVFNSSSVIEGNSVTLTLTTTNVNNGITVPYIISGVTSADINGASLTGNFVVNNNTATLTINTTDVNGDKILTVNLVGILPVVSATVSITDTAVEIPGIVNGGTPGTVTFTSVANGGNISTSMFDDIFDGGIVLTEIDGGLPNTSIFDTVLSGGTPDAVITETYDGGIVA